MGARKIAICNAKGGVGKTALAVNLAVNLARMSKTTLLVDLSPQADATCHLGLESEGRPASIYHIVTDKAETPEDAVIPTRINNLFMIPSERSTMEAVEIELAGLLGREAILDEKIKRFEERFDFIIFDCPPSLGLLTINGLMASGEFLLPVQAHYLALNALDQMFMATLSLEHRLGHRIAFTGVICTLFDERTRLSREVESELRRLFGPAVFESVIHYRTAVGESPTFGMAIAEYEPGKEADLNFREAALELLRRGKGGKTRFADIGEEGESGLDGAETGRKAVRRAGERFRNTLRAATEDNAVLAGHPMYRQLSEPGDVEAYRRKKRAPLSSAETDELWK
ncbi:MAG: ParA family protein [Nitrospinae bacterium]|nr:ParA family protein [Nitrospinota bacterium]